MSQSDDWRLESYGNYSYGLSIRHKRYYRWSESWDHDHCVFCWVKFMDADDPSTDPEPRTQHTGYAIAAHTINGRSFPDDYDWICETCYADLRDHFQWVVIEK